MSVCEQPAATSRPRQRAIVKISHSRGRFHTNVAILGEDFGGFDLEPWPGFTSSRSLKRAVRRGVNYCLSDETITEIIVEVPQW